MALVAHFDLEHHQMDVKTTFLNGNVDETIYMVQPENFVAYFVMDLCYLLVSLLVIIEGFRYD